MQVDSYVGSRRGRRKLFTIESWSNNQWLVYSVQRLVVAAGVTEPCSVNTATTTCSSRTVIPPTNRTAAPSATLDLVRRGKPESGGW